MLYFIYTLTDPRDTLIHYVGVTSDPNRRYLQHLQGSIYNERKNMWIKELLDLNLKPSLKIIDMVEGKEEAANREKEWIRIYIRDGAPLTNYHSIKERRVKKKEAVIETISKTAPEQKGWYPFNSTKPGTMEELDREWNAYLPTARALAQQFPRRNVQTEAGMLKMFIDRYRIYKRWKGVLSQWEEEKKKNLKPHEGPTRPLSIPV